MVASAHRENRFLWRISRTLNLPFDHHAIVNQRLRDETMSRVDILLTGVLKSLSGFQSTLLTFNHLRCRELADIRAFTPALDQKALKMAGLPDGKKHGTRIA